MRILHAPSNIANQAWAVSQGLRSLGHDSEVWHYGENPYSFPCDRAIEFPPEPKALWELLGEALERFDVFHFHFGRSLVPRQLGSIPGLWDLPLYRQFGKKVFFTFHGSDVRLPSKHMAENEWSYFKFADVPSDEDDIAKRLNIIRTYANAMWVCSPLNTPFVPDAWFHPRAILVEDWPFVGPARTTNPIVVHVPSSRGTKGSAFVVEGVEAAKARGLEFEFRLLEGLPHDEVKRAIREADVVVDNLLLGDYEVTGLEAMCAGKTVITRVDPKVTEQMGPIPILSADPATFGEVLERAVTDHSLRESLAAQGRAYVEKHHAAPVVAAQIAQVYERPPATIPLSFPEWASLAEARREERLEQQILELKTSLKTRKTEVVVAGTKRGPFTLLGARIDSFLRRLTRRGR